MKVIDQAVSWTDPWLVSINIPANIKWILHVCIRCFFVHIKSNDYQVVFFFSTEKQITAQNKWLWLKSLIMTQIKIKQNLWFMISSELLKNECTRNSHRPESVFCVGLGSIVLCSLDFMTKESSTRALLGEPFMYQRNQC